jgi:hypothetical protein
MRKVIEKIPTVDFASLFRRRPRSHKKNVVATSVSDNSKLRVSARRTLRKYQKTFKKLAFE